MSRLRLLFFFFFNDPATTEIYTLSLPDALPISRILKEKVREVTVVGPYRVRFQLHEPWPDFMTFYGTVVSGAGWIVPKKYVEDRKSTRLNSSHSQISYAVFCLKKKKTKTYTRHE